MSVWANLSHLLLPVLALLCDHQPAAPFSCGHFKPQPAFHAACLSVFKLLNLHHAGRHIGMLVLLGLVDMQRS